MGVKGTAITGLDVKELIDDLNRAYCDEWLAYYSYVYMFQTCSGPTYEDMQEFLKKVADEEREHIDELADRISELGGAPNADPTELANRANYPYPAPPEQMSDFSAISIVLLKAEANAIDVYNKLAHKTMGKDHVTYQLAMHILAEEVRHEEMFENLNLTSRKKALEAAGVK
jgi:Protein distantly related to bacterial ferritins